MGSEEHPGTDPAPAPSGRRGSRPAGTPQLEKLLVRDWGAPFLRDPVDLVRLSFMVGAAALIVAGELGQAVRLGLTMVLVLVPRLLRLPRLFDLGFILGMSLQAWGNVFGLFESISWWDMLTHFVLTGLVAATGYMALARLEVMPATDEQKPEAHHLVGIFVTVLSLGLAFEALYEMYEYAADQWLGTNLPKSLADTITDMLVSGLGSLAGALGVVAWTARGPGSLVRIPAESSAGDE